ncbi:protein FAM18B, putative [Entamoeba dispar SAW760]|uniref:Golgi apparatus membrane protein TVP23 homolog n=1 Tax=Entamoeba dispar (strain ATCC PRA-260 / SAW760) TaxID=370354 RepID=B0ESX9_ENTDS|nr:protein FAM18B, putative [Entamoeba dispar SAW760]EDR22342.1 protein FAM18B, putative [Entamoeba dispar SAW760]|eukprot:EDR22342.1 protein FAM18B, putative [Entamoeba dispar SAW760]
MDFQDATKIVQTTQEERTAENNQVIEKGSRHPIIAGLHIGLKLIAIIVYALFFIFMDGYFVISFSICLLLTAVDFWITKNISGRLLVGLRWWNKVNEDGSSQWIFEAMEDHQKVRLSYIEMMIFWVTMIAAPLLWVGVCFLCFLGIRINYLGLAIICFVMQSMNFVGFALCARGSRSVLKKRVKKVAVEQGTKVAVSAAASQF